MTDITKNLYVNQEKCLEWGIEDVRIGHLFNYLHDLPTWATVVEIVNGKPFYWCAKSKILECIPMLNVKPDTIKRWMKLLEDKGLIERSVVGLNRPFVRTTDKGKTWNKVGIKNPTLGMAAPTPSGSQSLPPRDGSPTYSSVNDSSVNDSLKDTSEASSQSVSDFCTEYLKHNRCTVCMGEQCKYSSLYKPKEERKKVPPKKEVFDFEGELKKICLDHNVIKDWMLVRKNKRATNSQTAFNALIREAKKANITILQMVTMCAENSWSGFKASYVENNSKSSNNKPARFEANQKSHLQKVKELYKKRNQTLI